MVYGNGRNRLYPSTINYQPSTGLLEFGLSNCGFRIVDFGLSNPHSAINNPQSKGLLTQKSLEKYIAKLTRAFRMVDLQLGDFEIFQSLNHQSLNHQSKCTSSLPCFQRSKHPGKTTRGCAGFAARAQRIYYQNPASLSTKFVFTNMLDQAGR